MGGGLQDLGPLRPTVPPGVIPWGAPPVLLPLATTPCITPCLAAGGVFVVGPLWAGCPAAPWHRAGPWEQPGSPSK